MSKKVIVKYFLQDKEVSREDINWEVSTSKHVLDNICNVEGSLKLEASPGLWNDAVNSLLLKDELKRYEKVNLGTFKEPQKGVKYNKGKLPLDIVLTRQFPKALNAISKATMFGHNKYFESDEDYLNFKNVEGGSQTYADALQRHSIDKGSIDEDSGLPHIFHKAWNALAELELWIEENLNKTDDKTN
jgi:hypothetical protein